MSDVTKAYLGLCVVLVWLGYMVRALDVDCFWRHPFKRLHFTTLKKSARKQPIANVVRLDDHRNAQKGPIT